MCNSAPILAAEYTRGTPRQSAVLYITRIANGKRTYLESIPVKGQREAHAIAKARGATAWNF